MKNNLFKEIVGVLSALGFISALTTGMLDAWINMFPKLMSNLVIFSIIFAMIYFVAIQVSLIWFLWFTDEIKIKDNEK